MYPTLTTERLILRPFQADDTAAMFALCSNPKQTEPVDWPLSDTPQKAERFLQRIMNCGMYWAIVLRSENKVVGAYGCSHFALPAAKKKEHSLIWLTLLEDYWKKGIAAEATEAVLRFAFVGAKAARVLSRHHIGICAAGERLQKHGFTPYSTPKDKVYVNYALSAKDYERQHGFDTSTITDTYKYHMPEPTQNPYSFDRPIRRIDSIRFLEQPTEYLCGQAVIAMLAGVSVDEVIGIMQNDKGTSTPLMRAALKHYGIKTAKRIPYAEGVALPECCILSLKLPGYGHWSLYFRGQYFDPEFGIMTELPPQASLRYIWEVIC